MIEDPKTQSVVPQSAKPNPDGSAKSIKSAARAKLVEKIRSELNIEKWPAIWQPAKSKNKPALRAMQREVTAADGNRMTSRVEVGFTQLGTLTTEEQKLLYVLIKLWEEDGKQNEHVFFSTRGLARMLKKKGWGTNVIHSVTKSLRKLRTIPVEWINSYFDRTAEGTVVVDRRPFTILGDLRIVERRQDGSVNSSLGYFKFDDHIRSNLQLNFTKPVCIEEFFKLKSEIAQLIYSHIDLMLSDKSKYERRSKELFDDLGLRNPEYDHMFERRRALERAVKELNGIRLSTGVLQAANVEKTKDGKDYKVSFQKVARAEIAAEYAEESAVAEIAAAVVINDYSKQNDPLLDQAEEAVRHFQKAVHGTETHQPQSKETSQALALITTHGLEKTQYIIDYAARKATETNFQIQHFGAILSYTSRALADLERRQKPIVTAQPVPGLREAEMESPEWARGKERLAILAPEEYRVRFEKAKADLQRQNPFLMRHWKEGNASFEKMIRSRLVRDLGNQPMTLAVFDPAFLTKFPWYAGPQNLPL